MGVNRIATGFLDRQALFHLQNNLHTTSQLQTILSSGKNINAPSDNAVGFTKLMTLTNTLSGDDRYKQNISDALSEVNLADSVLSNTTDLIHRAKELATQGATDTNNQAARDAISREIDAIVTQLVQIGNTTISGKYIFGGMRTGGAAFTQTGSTTVTYNGTPTTETWQRQVEISSGIRVTVNVNGQTLFGSVAPNGAPPPSTTGSGIIRTLGELRSNLLAGNTTEVRNRLDELDTDLNTVLNLQTTLGSVANQLELTANRIDDRKTALTQEYSAIQEVDLAKTISDLNRQESIFQTSLGVSARVLQTSLLSFLR